MNNVTNLACRCHYFLSYVYIILQLFRLAHCQKKKANTPNILLLLLYANEKYSDSMVAVRIECVSIAGVCTVEALR